MTLKKEFDRLKWLTVNAIIEGRYDVTGVDKDTLHLDVEGVKVKYFYKKDHFLYSHFVGDLDFCTTQTESDLLDHVLADYIPRQTTCECCGQKCTNQ